MFGHVLEVKRTIRIPVFGASVAIEDTVTNLTPRDEELMQIYHCNFGCQLLSEKSRLVLPEEWVFFQKMTREFWAKLENLELGVNMTISWSGDTLPILSQWRSMASGDYILGLEPTNCCIMGRHEERENGILPVLKAFESVTNTMKIDFEDERKDNDG